MSPRPAGEPVWGIARRRARSAATPSLRGPGPPTDAIFADFAETKGAPRRPPGPAPLAVRGTWVRAPPRPPGRDGLAAPASAGCSELARRLQHAPMSRFTPHPRRIIGPVAPGLR